MRRPLKVPASSAPQPAAAASDDGTTITRLPPLFYIHVLDTNSNLTRIEVGPQVFTPQQHETILAPPAPFVVVPPRHYCVIANPVERASSGDVVLNEGAVTLRHGEKEIRTHRPPFPLYPGEKLEGEVAPFQIVPDQSALRLRCVRDFTLGKRKVTAGDEYLFRGPGTYIPRTEEEIVQVVEARMVRPNEALRLRARKQCLDSDGTQRLAGEEWLVRVPGPYLPNVDEEVVGVVQAFVLTPQRSLHVRAIKTFVDEWNANRPAGSEWLVSFANTSLYVPGVFVEVVGPVDCVVLTRTQYAVILDPVDTEGRPQLGKKSLKRGPAIFFLQPGEKLENGTQDVHLLAENEGLLLRAEVEFPDETANVKRMPGDLWMVKGPCDYVPPVQVLCAQCLGCAASSFSRFTRNFQL